MCSSAIPVKYRANPANPAMLAVLPNGFSGDKQSGWRLLD
jgi:hypothetical protein